jgi:hypothetical protein
MPLVQLFSQDIQVFNRYEPTIWRKTVESAHFTWPDYLTPISHADYTAPTDMDFLLLTNFWV